MIKRLFLIAILSMLIFGCRKDFFENEKFELILYGCGYPGDASSYVKLEEHIDNLTIDFVGLYNDTTKFVLKKKDNSYSGIIPHPYVPNRYFEVFGFFTRKRKPHRIIGHFTQVGSWKQKGRFEIIPFKEK